MSFLTFVVTTAQPIYQLAHIGQSLCVDIHVGMTYIYYILIELPHWVN